MQARLVLATLIASFALAGTALGQSKPSDKPEAAKDGGKKDAGKKDAGKKDVAADPAAQAPKGPLKDPENKKGISPYMEAVAKGEAAYVARDFPGAVTAFQDAVKIDGQQMLAFYRLGEAQLAAGKPEEAEAVWNTALSKTGPDDLKAKVHFVLADLRERQSKLPQAKEAWGTYGSYVKEHADAKGYAGTSDERTKMIDRREKDVKDYAAVKERIIKRQQEREKEAAENAKKDKLNK